MPENDAEERSKKTILIVDDDVLIALSEARALGRLGYRTIIASNGEKAVDLATNAADPVDLVLMDIDLGTDLDGAAAARRILSVRPIPIIFLTGHAEQEMVASVRGITRYGYVTKDSGDFVLASSVETAFELFEAHAEIVRLLADKELLLKEVHHRIKNNLFLLQSLMSLQAEEMKSPEAAAALRDAQTRVQSIGVLYDRLCRSETFKDTSFRAFLTALIREVVGAFSTGAAVRTITRLDDFAIDARISFPLAIIVNELLINALRHAFGGRKEGSIRITGTRRERRVTLVIQDDGPGWLGLEAGERGQGFGLTLVGLLAGQIDGTFAMENRRGLRCTLTFDIEEAGAGGTPPKAAASRAPGKETTS
jgi:two-component sensor histidine kinase